MFLVILKTVLDLFDGPYESQSCRSFGFGPFPVYDRKRTHLAGACSQWQPCAGTTLGLDNTTSLGTMLQADAQGQVFFRANFPAGVCGTTFLQASDPSNCGTSEVVTLL